MSIKDWVVKNLGKEAQKKAIVMAKNPEIKKKMMESAQMTGGVKAVGGTGPILASKLKQLSNKERKFYEMGRDVTKRMGDKKMYDKLMSARAKLLR